MTSKHDQNSSS